MTKEQYTERRNRLITEAKAIMEAEAFDKEKFDAKKKEVEELDNRFELEAKAHADVVALEKSGAITDITQKGREVVGEREAKTKVVLAPDSGSETKEPENYVTAWYKSMTGKPLTGEEENAYRIVNDYSHTTKNTPQAIPQTVAKGIWEEVGNLHPLWNDAQKTFVKGTLKIIKEDTSSDAKWYDEATKTEDGTETFASVELTGCELARAVTVTWMLKEMAMEDFIPYIQRKIAAKMGDALGYGVCHGKGKPGSGESFKPEPRGIATALLAEASTPQVVEYDAADPLTYKKLTEARGKIKSGYGRGVAIYANSKTIWGDLANLTDKNGRPMFISDAQAGGVGRIFGLSVKEEDGMLDGEILMSNAQSGYLANINKTITLAAEDHIKDRVTDYAAYGIVDGDVVTTKAHALLRIKPSTEDNEEST